MASIDFWGGCPRQDVGSMTIPRGFVLAVEPCFSGLHSCACLQRAREAYSFTLDTSTNARHSGLCFQNCVPSFLAVGDRWCRAAVPLVRPAATANKQCLQTGQQLQLECTDIALGGKGICRDTTGLVVFTDALPGERLTAEVVKVKKGYVEASKVAILRPHANATPHPCPYFGTCGGCNYQSLQYGAQLQAKELQLAGTLQRVGGLDLSQCNVLPIESCQAQYAYRNNMQFTFIKAQQPSKPPSCSSSLDKPLAQDSFPAVLGLHAMDNPSHIVPINTCLLQDQPANQLLQAANQACAQQPQLSAYDFTTQQGFLRKLIIRRNTGGQHLIVIVTASHQPGLLDGLVQALCDAGVTVAGVVNRVVPPSRAVSSPPTCSTTATDSADSALLQGGRQPTASPARPAEVPTGSLSRVRSKGQVRERRLGREVLGRRSRKGQLWRKLDLASAEAGTQQHVEVLFGVSEIQEQLFGLDFSISADSFFQVNTAQAEVLYSMVKQAADLKPSDTVMDLFCGTGTIGLSVAHACRHVYGFEYAPSSIANARQNADANGIANATFVQADLDIAVGVLSKHCPKPDVVITDPARAGMSAKLTCFLVSCGARTIVYVSCNPATQARDIARLCKAPGSKYQLTQIQACDMFPNTAHIESVAVLQSMGH